MESANVADAPDPTRQWLLGGAKVALTVLVTWFIVTRLGISLDDARGEMDPSRWQPAWGALLGASLLLLVGYLVSAVLWGRMVQELGGPWLGLTTSCSLFMTANMGRYVPGKVWQIAGLAMLARRHGVPASIATAAALLGQGIALIGATLIGLFVLLGADGTVRGAGAVTGVTGIAPVTGVPGATGVAGWAVGGILALLAITAVPQIFRRLTSLMFRVLRQPIPAGFGDDWSFGLRWLLLYVGNWLIYATAFWAMSRSFRPEGSFLELAPAFAAAYVLGYMALFAPAGIGVREGALVGFLQPVLGTGAVGVALLARLWTTLVELVPGTLFAFGQLMGSDKEQADVE